MASKTDELRSHDCFTLFLMAHGADGSHLIILILGDLIIIENDSLFNVSSKIRSRAVTVNRSN